MSDADRGVVDLEGSRPGHQIIQKRIGALLSEAQPICRYCATASCDKHDTRLQRIVFLLVPGGMFGWLFATLAEWLPLLAIQGICLGMLVAGSVCHFVDQRRRRAEAAARWPDR